MKNIRNFYQHLNEGMNYAPLYHIVDDKKLVYLLDNDILKGKSFSGVSFSRSKMLNSYLGSTVTSFIKLEINAEKLSNHYKIKPVVYKSATGISFTDEREEYCKDNISNARNYISKVILMGSMVNAMSKEVWGSDYFSQYGKENLQDKIKKVIHYCEKYSLPLYVQYGSKIVKDDAFIASIINKTPTKVLMGYRLFYRGYKRIKRDKYGFTINDVLIDAITGENLALENDRLVIGLDYENVSVFIDGVNAEIETIRPHLIPVPIDDTDEPYNLYRATFKYKQEDIVEEFEELGKQVVKLKTAYLKDIDNIR